MKIEALRFKDDITICGDSRKTFDQRDDRVKARYALEFHPRSQVVEVKVLSGLGAGEAWCYPVALVECMRIADGVIAEVERPGKKAA